MSNNSVLLMVCVVVGLAVLGYMVYDTYFDKPVITGAHVVTTTTKPVMPTPPAMSAAAPAVENFTSCQKPATEGFEDAGTQQPQQSPEVLGAQDLLPAQCADSPYAQVVPNGQGNINDGNLLNAGYHIGVNTVGSSLRNANLQLRSEPANPQVKVSPWNQTTIETDINRRELEIGN